MSKLWQRTGVIVIGVLLVGASVAVPQDWPQFRGPNRDAKVTNFTTPATWPKTLTQKWKVNVGIGEASPVLAGDKLYTFARQGGEEVISCLEAGTGKVVWQDKYATDAVGGSDSGHPGPRATPAVAEGKVGALGVNGVLSCLDANTGKVAWRKDTKGIPKFHTSSSPLIANGRLVAQVGGSAKGGMGKGGGGKGKGGDKGQGGGASQGVVIAYDLNTGEPRWTCPEHDPAYASPVVMTVDGTKQIVVLTNRSLVGINLADGKQLWDVPYQTTYNSNTPIVEGQTVIISGPSGQAGGTAAYKVEKKGDGFVATKSWDKAAGTSMYNTPVLKDGLLYGLAAGGRGQGPTRLYCQNAQTGDMLWTDNTQRGECGAVLDAGSVMLALTSDGNLFAFKPNKTGYEEVAKYPVAEPSRGRGAQEQTTWSYPAVAGNRVFVKDHDSVTLWTID